MSRINDQKRTAIELLREEYGPPPDLPTLGTLLQKALAEREKNAIAPPQAAPDIPAPKPGADGPIVQAMRHIGANDRDVSSVARYWASEALFSPAQMQRVLPDVEKGIARLILADAKQRAKSVDRALIYDDVVYGALCLGNKTLSVAAVSMFYGFENVGIRFETHREVYRFHGALTKRIGFDANAPEEERTEALIGLEDLLSEFGQHLPHLEDAHRTALSTAEPLLLGIDLFADGRGEVALCKCLRLAIAFSRRRVETEETFWLFRAFPKARVDDLLTLAERPDVRTRPLTRLLDQPERIGTHGYDALVAQLTR